ncbi:hypothetical protein A3K34_01295 [candidate division WWE3 bacterium RIFOXYC1_FULL_40_10]|uniref:Pilus assembly protein PilO n=1 Tax=candidate division WWE3 bacterium RIFOXYA2_FULL_46_9 TaxID=1802636 RepID=A0A1F4W1Z4_UNCKA|nr:MAG: hypothetical protein A3K58_01295 [candidate division WWE3 bacterium RIFOXYB1_FULL_40_22]OGC61505.1 MAG: hypothetical protein A3K37_01295 [candidate division WWE3 bacterium RIFOXYA1_FULL_40_11]OGC63437.1 MAG: hypothetical protein A2264_01775 [candidate division WWE3 bacterium RIFOXYA2_FULL_46_9]OGC64815.1 MAG: hypothetical protein A2326_02165 [candidate division WWE3 bacterium RIFOXYB2_FULL_41_6]OGC65888.1 MAG: hypothetical protein A3K34_01295 [candidate division WWE3 bacterium RIFOXYC1_
MPDQNTIPVQTPIPTPPTKSVDASPLVSTLLNFVVPLICLVLILTMGVFVIYPSYKSWKPLKEEISTNESMKVQLETKVAKLKKLVDFKTAVLENSALVDKVLVSESSAPLFLDEITQIAQSSGFDISRFGSSKPRDVVVPPTAGAAAVPAAPYEEITATLGASASYNQVVVFLEELERAARVLDVNDVRFSNSSTGTKSESGQVDLSISGPYISVTSTAVTDEPIEFDIASRDFIDLISMIKSLRYYTFTNSISTLKPEVVVPVEE